MKELSLYQKIAFAILCLGAFTNTFLWLPQLTFLRLGVLLTFTVLFFSKRKELGSNFYAVTLFYFAYIIYTLLLTLICEGDVTLSLVVNFLFILLLVVAALWLFCSAPRDALRFFYLVCALFLFVSFVLASIEMTTGWHLPMSNMHLTDNKFVIEADNKNYPTGFFYNTNDFAVIVALAFCFIMSYRVNLLENRKRGMDFLFVALCVGCLCLTRCRTALVAVALFCLFLQRKFVIRHKVFFITSAAVAFVAGLVIVAFFADHSISIRQNLYLYSFVSVFDSYGLGFGLNGPKNFFSSFDNYNLFGHIVNTHSYLLEFLITSGLPFFVGYLCLLAYLMRKIAVNHGRNEFWVMIPLYAILLFAPSSSGDIGAQYLFFCAMAGYAGLSENVPQPKCPSVCS